MIGTELLKDDGIENRKPIFAFPKNRSLTLAAPRSTTVLLIERGTAIFQAPAAIALIGLQDFSESDIGFSPDPVLDSNAETHR